MNSDGGNSKTWEEAAFLHLFFLNPTTVDEYRNFNRNAISEWFAILNKIEAIEWVVVFDSSKARERKNRGAIIERIKNDFSKHTNRIKEAHDVSSYHSLLQNIQTHLLTALEAYVSHHETYLTKCSDKYSDSNFNFVTFCGYQLCLSRLYQSLGIFEHALAMFDELDAMFSLICIHLSNGQVPKWMVPIDADKKGLHGCPLFFAMLQCDEVWEGITVTQMRCIIYANQILMTLYQFNEHLRDNLNVESLRVETVKTILRYSHHCLSVIFENRASFKLENDDAQVHCWTIAFCLEAMQITSLFVEITHLEQVAEFICALKVAICRATSILSEKWLSIDRAVLIEWFDQGVTECGEPCIETNAVSELRQLLSSDQQMTHYMQKYHESSIALLKHFGMPRQARQLGWQLAKFLLSSDRVEGAIPYLISFASSLIADGSYSNFLLEILKFTVKYVEKLPGIHLKELVDYYLIFIMKLENEEERQKYCGKFLEITDRRNISRIILHWSNNSCPPCCFIFKNKCPLMVATPGSAITYSLQVQNNLPQAICKYEITCRFAHVSEDNQKPIATRYPQFECSYNQSDGISRFACIWTGDAFGNVKMFRRSSVGDPVGKSDNFIVFGDQSLKPLSPGMNLVNLTAVADGLGVYVLEFIELFIGHSFSLRVDHTDIKDWCKNVFRRPMCLINSSPRTITLNGMEKGEIWLLSGVIQKIDLNLFTGTESIEAQNSFIHVHATEASDLEFWDPSTFKWSQSCDMIDSVSNFSGQNNRITIYLYKPITSARDNQASKAGKIKFVEEIFLTWIDKVWNFSLEFISYFDLDMTTSLLEERVLLDCLISLHKNEEWIIKPHDALLQRINDHEFNDTANLLNRKLTDIEPHSTYRIVWALPKNKCNENNMEMYEMKLLYRAQPGKSFVSNEFSAIYDRDYSMLSRFSLKNESPYYELCAQVLSSQPGAVLCRVDNTCDMIVSLRSLTNRIETLAVRIDADPSFWTINERLKLICVKESGLGQISFAIVPKVVGFLPHPSIVLYAYNQMKSVTEYPLKAIDNANVGGQLASFVRTNGKQVHVLGAFSLSSDQKMREKSKKLKDAKRRLSKLFE